MRTKKILLALLVLSGLKLAAQPTTTSPTPTQASADVISVFSDAYTNLSGTDFNPNWGQGTIVSDFSISGNVTKKYQNLDYQGTQFASAINASSMEKLHVDIWTDNGATFDFYLVNTSTSQEQAYRLTPSQSGWVSYDIPLSSYAAGIVSNIGQFKFVDVPMQYHASTKTYYLDNIFFWKSANVPTIAGFSFPIKYTNDSSFTITPPTSNSTGTFSYTSSNTNVATISGSVVTIVGAGTTTITAFQSAAGGFVSASVTAALNVLFPPPPSTPAAPTHDPSNVNSLFSDSYSNVPSINWYPNWGQNTTHLDLTLSGNTIKKYDNLNYQGVEFSSNLNVSTMEKLHFDIWTPNCSTLDFYLINTSPQFEKKVTVNPTLSGWNSFDIPLTSYNGVDLTKVRQFKLVGNNGSTIYLDNIFFWKSAGTPTITGFSVPTKYLGDAAFTLTAPTSNSSGAFTYTSSNPNVATISGSTVTIVGLGSTTITANQAADATYNTGSTSAVLNVRYAPPGTAAPTPTLNSSIVKSLYSDAYTNVSGTDWNPNWGQTTIVSGITIGGNATLRYDNLNYQGVQFLSGVDASGYNHVHFDLYTPNCTAFEFFLVNTFNSTEQKVTVNPTTNGWNSFDIALSSFPAINLANIGQLKLVGTPFGSSTVFLDNIYFWNAVAPTLGSFSVPAKELGNAAFSLTAPTSNSAGSFSYTSSNTGVATISGSTVTIVGIGTSTITATQAASGSYGSASITASLVVTAPSLPTAPTTAAATPNKPQANVISMYSNAYPNRTVDTWSAGWDQADIADTTITGNDTKKYSNLVFSGIEFTSSTINATNAEYFHIDIWTPNTSVFRVKLVDFGANGTYGGGDDKEHELTFSAPALSSWASYDIPMSSFTNLTTKAHLAQMIFVSNNSTVYFDNVYFWANSCLNPVSNPSVSIATAATTICSNSSVTFNATASNGGTAPTFQWKQNGSNVGTGSSITFAPNTIVNGNYITCVITRTDGCANDGNSNIIMMTVKNSPAMGVITNGTVASNYNFCLPVASYQFYNSMPSYGGVWASSNQSVATVSSSGVLTTVANGNTTLSYTVTGSNGCVSTSSVTVNVNSVTTPTITGASSMCVGSGATYNSNTNGGIWSVSGRGTINSNSGAFTAISAGSAYIYYKITSGACSNTASKLVTINSNPIPSISYSPTTNIASIRSGANFCANKTFSLVGTPSGGTWSSVGTCTVNATNGLVNTGASASTGNRVTYTYTDANSCVGSRSITGNIVVCSSRGVNNVPNTVVDYVLYPNPAKTVINLKMESVISNGFVSISDLYGKKQISQTLSIGVNVIDVSKLSKGMYLITITNNNENNTQKLIIE